MKKYLKVLLILVVVLSLMSTVAFASGNKFLDAKNKSQATDTALTGAVNSIGSSNINIVQTLGYVIAVVMVIVVGIQWLVGTPAKKQELRGKLINVIIGAILIACGVTILGFVANVGTELGSSLDSTFSSISTRV